MFCNRLNKNDALKKLSQETVARRTVSFYRYTLLEDPNVFRDLLFQEWQALGVLGRVYLAREGINAQISVPEPYFEAFEQRLNALPSFSGVPFKFALEEGLSFWKLTIKVKNKIVADGIEDPDFDARKSGTYLSPKAFHEALERPDTVVVDARNHFESRIGKFEKALAPDADTFREELPLIKELLKGKENKNILLYCTGGIRCEKASAYLKHHGFENVFQLEGGIIHYAHDIKKRGLRSRFIGKNFVFDERIAEKVTDDVLSHCDQCGTSCDRYVNCRNAACNLLFLQCGPCEQRLNGACTDQCFHFLLLPKEDQKAKRKNIRHTFQRYKSQIRPFALGGGLPVQSK